MPANATSATMHLLEYLIWGDTWKMMSIFGQLTPLFVQYEAKWWWTSDLINSGVKRKPLLGWSAALQGKAWLQSRDRSWRVYCTECGVSCCIPVSGYSLIGLVDNVDNVDRPAWLGIGGGCAESALNGLGSKLTLAAHSWRRSNVQI